MARFVFFAFLLLASIVSSNAHTQLSHERRLQDHFFATKNRCGLSRFSLATFDNEFIDFLGKPGRDRHRMMAAIWETTDPSCLHDFGLVQFIRGCIYNISRVTETGEEEFYFGVGRENRGRITIFRHRDWEVDSVDLDPLYSSYDSEDTTPAKRFHWHKFSRYPLLLKPTEEALAMDQRNLFNSTNYDYVMNVLPNTLKQTFVTDLPSGSSYKPADLSGKESIRISSLEFKSCLYHTKDIPLMADPASFTVEESEGGPIHCFEWSDKMNLDHEKKELIRTEELDRNCL